MKKINVIILLFVGILGMTTITSCNPEPDTDVLPTLGFISEASSITADATVDTLTPLLFKVTAKQNPNTKKALQSLRVQSFMDNSPVKDTTVTINDDDFLGSFNYDATITPSKEEKFIFTLTDKAGETVDKTITITTNERPAVVAPTPVVEYTARLLGGQANSTEGSFYDAHTGTVKLVSDANSSESTIDLIFAYEVGNQFFMGAPSNSDIQASHTNVASWTTQNVTFIEESTLTVAEFDAIENVEDLPAVTSTATKIDFLLTDKIFSFETTDGKTGIVKVNSTTGSGGANTAIDIDVKIQP
ncbi:MAG: hypothetical protein ACPG4Y_05845 [Chitinophagales bacterium]